MVKESLLGRFEEFLVGKGLRLTGQRREIARVFFESKGHHSAEDIYHRVQQQLSGIGTATVYRTMKLLHEAGLATGLNLGDGFARYESPARQGHHDHLVCRGCGDIVEFSNDRIEELQEKVARKYGFVVTDHRLELYGLCGSCR
jgi:Fur family ferric uptake transcriptional regulator